MSNKVFLIATSIVLCQSLHAQFIMGNVVDPRMQSLVGAQVVWLESKTGTTTNENGYFKLERKSGDSNVIISFLGFVPDTFPIASDMSFEVFTLQEGITLNTVEVQTTRNSNSFSRLDPLNIEKLNSGEFRKAACCSLSESFQTSNAVDVSYTNAATGSKEIQFLGLRGIYSNLLIENHPAYSGIIKPFAYDYLSGTWLDRVDIQKGASSVVNGVQSMTGAINVQLKKPNEDYPVFLNAFGDLHGRIESNVHLNKKWNNARFSGIYVNTAFQQKSLDHNHDGFQDEPEAKRLNALIRNTLFGKTLEGQINGQFVYEKKESGQLKQDAPYRLIQEVQYAGLSGNLGYVGFNDPDNSIGSIYNLSHTKIDARFGSHHLMANESNAHFIWLMNYTFIDERHKISTGPKLVWSQAEESMNGNKISYNEKIASLFIEHNFKNQLSDAPTLNTTIGLHADWIAGGKPMWSPRASLRYLLSKDWTIRASIGRGFRFVRLYAENLNLLATSKQWNLLNPPTVETSWNSGMNLVGTTFLNGREIQINADAYYTWFQTQMVIDLDQNAQQIFIYPLNGKSRAFQAILTLAYEPFQFMNFKIGGKFTDTKLTYQSGFREVPMVPRYRGLISVDFHTIKNNWLLNITSNHVGSMRLSDKSGVPATLLQGHKSPTKPYWLLQSQLTYVSKSWEIYSGAENILDYTQHNAIIDPKQPMGDYFNAAEVYAPISGTKYYLGIKWKLFSAE